jgi:hypothetical protein
MPLKITARAVRSGIGTVDAESESIARREIAPCL